MVLYQNGENAAFEILYKRHSGLIFGYLKKGDHLSLQLNYCRMF